MSIIACSIDECEKSVLARGWCGTHYRRWQSTGSTETTRFIKRPCSIEGCEKVSEKRTWCAAHYRRWRLTGSTGAAEIKQFKKPIVDGRRECSVCLEWTPIEGFNAASHLGSLDHRCRECQRAVNAKWREANPAYWQEWQKANPQETRDIANRRRAKKVSGEYEKIDRGAVFERDNFECHICSEPIPMDAKFPHPLSPTLDHVIPLNKGGGHLYSNLAAAHFRCNVIKGDRLPA